MSELKKLTAGDSATWEKSLNDYKASDGWSLTYSLVNQLNQYTITSSASGDDFVASVTAADSAKWVAGKYKLYGYVTNGSQRKTVFKGDFWVRPDITKPQDHRSYAERVLSAIEAVIEKTATKDQEQITIDGQTLVRRKVEDLIKLRDRMRREVRSQKARAKAKKTGRLPGRVLVRNS